MDWEVELVAVIGRAASRVDESRAWEHIAGRHLGQDLSERVGQLIPPVPQFSLAKSFPGFGPTGPAVVTVDELSDPDDLAIWCELDGETMQHGRTSQMILNVPQLVAHLSSVLTLLPGDIIFTGTPSGVGRPAIRSGSSRPAARWSAASRASARSKPSSPLNRRRDVSRQEKTR